MQLAIKRDLLEDLAAIRFEGRAEVVNVDAAQLGHQPICHAGGNAAHPEVIHAKLAPAADDVVTGRNLFQKQRDVGGIVLQIAIHGDNVLSTRMVETGGQSRGLAEVAAQLDHRDAAIDRGDLAQHGEGMVARSVIDQHNFEGSAGGLHHRFQAVVEIGDVLLLIVQRDDDGVLGHRPFIISRQAFPKRRIRPRSVTRG